VRPVELARVIEAAVESVQLAADSKGIRLRLDLGAEPAQISADAGRLQQVFWNLLSNAVKFTPRGGRVDLRVERSEPHLAVIISDTGKGILPEFLPFVFDRFRQADSSTTRRFGGLGLGLSIVRHIVELHGGSVEAASRGDGQGSTFTVRLPLKHGADTDSRRLQTATALAEPASASSAAGILEGVKVLAVDDELDSLDFVVSALRVNGAEVQSATCVEDALNVLKSWDATLLISDLAMPEENGYALIEKVRAQDSLNRLPAIALSAYAQESDRQQALAAGYTYYIAKPIGPSELVDAVAEIAKGDKKITAGV